MTYGDDPERPRTTAFRPTPLQGARQGEPARPAYQARPQPALADDDVPSPPVPPSPRNPMMARAGPILARIAAQRVGRIRMSLRDLHREMTAEIAAFDAEVSATYPEWTANSAVYAVCATVDDVAQGLPDQGADAAIYAQQNMVYQFFKDNKGGDHFVDLMQRMLQRPGEYQDLIELFHACMAAGFGGRIRVAGGAEGSQAQMQQMFQAMPHARQTSAVNLSPRWKGSDAPARTTGVWGGVAVVAAIAVGVLLLIYLILTLAVGILGGGARRELADIFPKEEVSLADPAGTVIRTPPASDQKAALSQCLDAEQTQNLLRVEENGTSVWVRTTAHSNLELFKPGSAQLEPGVRPLLEKIGQCMVKQSGPVTVVGYTDSDQIHTVEFPNNQRLSDARAQSAAGIIRGAMGEGGGRVTAEGRGDADPVSLDDSSTGRRLNRRVEIVLRRGG